MIGGSVTEIPFGASRAEKKKGLKIMLYSGATSVNIGFLGQVS